jgi:hypothetical protein
MTKKLQAYAALICFSVSLVLLSLEFGFRRTLGVMLYIEFIGIALALQKNSV